MQESRVKFHLGQNEDCSLGESTSESSETLCQRGSGAGQCMCDFSDGGIRAVEHIFFQKVSASQVKCSASHETVVTVRNLSALLDMRRYRVWLIKPAPEDVSTT